MAPNPLEKTSSYYRAQSNEPVQIIGKVFPAPIEQPRHQPRQYPWRIVWRNVFIFIYLHAAALYGLYLIVTGAAMFKTFVWAIGLGAGASMGVTAGAHRLWAHRTYKARLPLRMFLAFLHTISLQNDLHEWVRDHRVHHKFTDTDADPHNASRGFFFSHMGWLLVKKHKEVMSKGKTVDLSDLEADPVVRFQRRFYVVLSGVCCFGMPTVVPVLFWNENLLIAYHTAAVFRYVLSLHFTWLVNSAAHMYGFKPYEKNIKATDSKTVAILAVGEGWHNYHHVFPWDYKAAELGNYRMNWTTAFLDLMARLGQAYDLKTVSTEMINKRVKRTGDGTRPVDPNTFIQEEVANHDDADNIWGWDDKDLKDLHKQLVEIHHPEQAKAA